MVWIQSYIIWLHCNSIATVLLFYIEYHTSHVKCGFNIVFSPVPLINVQSSLQAATFLIKNTVHHLAWNMPIEYHSIGLKQMLLYQASKTCSLNIITWYKKYTNDPSVSNHIVKWLISTHIFYLGGYRFNSWPEDRVYISQFVSFSSGLHANAGIVSSKMPHSLPHHLNSANCNHLTIWLQIINAAGNASLKNTSFDK